MLRASLLNKDIILFRKECSKMSKLRTYNSLFSPFIDHQSTIQYTRLCLPFILRKRIAQLRIGVLPIRIETDRYLNIKIPSALRYCKQPNCQNMTNQHLTNLKVEDEVHFLINCEQYQTLRNTLYSKITTPGFVHFSQFNQFSFLLTCSTVAKLVGQYIADAYDNRPSKM